MDDFSAEWLVEPLSPVKKDQVLAFLSDHFGITGSVEPLGSNHDCNFRVRTEADGTDYVLKIFNPVTDRAALTAHCDAIEQLAQAMPQVRLPRVRAGTDSEFLQTFVLDGQELDSLLLHYVPGEPIMDSRYLAPRVVAQLGELAGRVTTALEDFDKPPADRPHLWDLRNALAVVESLAPEMGDTAAADQVLAAARAAAKMVEPVAAKLPVQVIHGDLADNNLVCEIDRGGRPLPVGIIDFGDLMHSWAVAELAVACTSVLHHHGATPASVLPAVKAFHEVRPLSPAELDVLWPLVILRGAVLVASGRYTALRDADNSYASAALDREWRMFEVGCSVPAEVMAAQLRATCGVETTYGALPTVASRLLPDLPSELARLDLSVCSDDLHSGRWLAPSPESTLAAETLASGASAVLTEYGEHQLTRTRVDGPRDAETLALGVALYVSEPLSVHAPWSGTAVQHAEDVLRLSSDGQRLVLSGIATGLTVGEEKEVLAGQPLGRVADRGDAHRLHVQLSRLETVDVPAFVSPGLDAGWLAVCPDPTGLVATASAAANAADAHDLLDRRDSAFATVQEHYFDSPPRIERGWRQYLVDTQGRGYIDMLNNVTILGHGHPRLSDAVHRQWRRLNTNSRFHYSAVVELSERLTETLPDGLDTVFLVNSGSESVDLALRLAWAVTGRQDVVAVGEAYHGWTYATDAVSTSIADNPNALDSRPEWVHTVPAPNSYRGIHRGAEAHRYGPEAAALITELAESGRAPAAFVAEAYYGNAGGIALPDGYLAEVYAAARAAGGLCIADEVQVGYGRLGSYFWGFEQQGVVPDIVTIAKAMGNGHPLGAVVTSREIAESFRTQGYFFSSAGGSPVSSVVGLTVLDALRDEALQENARRVGEHLKQRLEKLAERHPLIGAVHGSGLYLGVEFVRDRDTLEPAAEETAAICERLLELGIVVQPTSDRMCVLKIKPPLCLTETSADVFVDALGEALTHGW